MTVDFPDEESPTNTRVTSEGGGGTVGTSVDAMDARWRERETAAVLSNKDRAIT